MKKINWKIVGATLSSLLTMLAALPYQLGDIATIIPPKWKSNVFIVGAVATVLLRLWNTRMTIPPAPPAPTPTPGAGVIGELVGPVGVPPTTTADKPKG